MKGPDHAISRTIMLYGLALPCLALLVLLTAVGDPSRADASGMPDEAAFQAMQHDLDACMQPGMAGESARLAFSRKYNVPLAKLEQLAAAGANHNFWLRLLCEVQIQTGVGLFAWKWCATQDGWNYDCGRPDISEYCMRYYESGCNRVFWEKGCLERTSGRKECFKRQ